MSIVFLEHIINSIFRSQFISFDRVTAKFDGITDEIAKLYTAIFPLVTEAPLYKLFDENCIRTISIESENFTSPKFTYVLRSVLIYIGNITQEIEEIIRNAESHAIYMSKKSIKPNEFDINIVKFQDRFEKKKTNWKDLKNHVQTIITKTKNISSVLDEERKTLIAQLSSLTTPSGISIQKINKHLVELASYLTNTEPMAEPAIIDELVNGLDEIANLLVKEEGGKSSKYLSPVEDFAKKATEKLITYRGEVKSIHSQIYDMRTT